jgi:very-short-patch-repair endonuclease
MVYNAVAGIVAGFSLKVVNMPRKLPDLDINHLVSEYRSGRSVLDLSREFCVSRPTVTQRLVKAGVKLRTISEQNIISFDRIGPERRAAMTRAAHDAVRGSTKSFESLAAAAISKQRTLSSVSPVERKLMADLSKCGINAIPQLAIGPYNCDLACHPVAVEVFGGHWHFSGRHFARAQKRINYLGNAGWHVLMVVVGNTAAYRYSDITRDYIASYVKAASSDPSTAREYRVIDCRGDTLAAGRCDDDDVSIKPAFRNRQNPATGRYERVAG